MSSLTTAQIMRDIFNNIWTEPPAPNPPAQGWLDWGVLGAVVICALVEVFVRDEIVWRTFSLCLTVSLALAIPWRRVYPAASVAIPFGINGVLQVATLLIGVEWEGLYTGVFLLILPYSLFRWGSGRQACLGLTVIAISFLSTMVIERPPLGEIIGAILFVLFPSSLGATVRFRNAAERRASEQVRLKERELLARELHDTVGHYVSAIAIQAQAGKAAADLNPNASLEALDTIEAAASKALGEMRSIVRAMRDDSEVEFTPAVSIEDIYSLASTDGLPLQVSIDAQGDLSHLDTSVTATLYRLAQESITNAVRHAQGARHVRVKLTGSNESIALRVEDDGKLLTSTPPPGLGLQGMKERVSLLGGSFESAPGRHGGWIVSVALPRQNNAP